MEKSARRRAEEALLYGGSLETWAIKGAAHGALLVFSRQGRRPGRRLLKSIYGVVNRACPPRHDGDPARLDAAVQAAAARVAAATGEHRDVFVGYLRFHLGFQCDLYRSRLGRRIEVRRLREVSVARSGANPK